MIRKLLGKNILVYAKWGIPGIILMLIGGPRQLLLPYILGVALFGVCLFYFYKEFQVGRWVYLLWIPLCIAALLLLPFSW